ncbi:MAG: ABC transporter ATP-binding protein [Rhodobacteraceae bacterium]|nr:ABC transporter ATP-binding protein [Paracoccaceae bacterium]
MQDALWFENTDSSKILVHVTQSAGAARTVIDVIVTSVIRDALTLVGMVGVMVWQNAVLSLVFFVVMPVALLSVRVVMGRVSAVTREGFVGQAEINKVIRETSTGLRVIRSFGLERLLQVRMDSAIRDGQVRANTISRFESLTLPLMDTLAGFAIGIVIMANTFSGRVGTPASAGEIMAFITALLMAYEPAKRLSRVRVTLEAAFNGVRMMFSILDMPDAIADAPDAVDLPRGKGAVSFKNVTFAYSRKKPILNNLTLDFAPGKVTAIVGPSGGGKSTIMSLLLRVYDPKAGKITIDGFDLRHVTRASLRHVLSYAGQNTFLFSTSVRDNIRMGRENATDSEVEAAAKCAQAHDFIMALPNGYDTQVGENGIFFSGGQRQRLSLARAILKDAPVLLLDEATSALDNYSEGLVRDAITQVTTGRTTIFIAHRLSTVMVADEVMYIEAGQLVEHGPLQELLNSDTRFAALFRKERTMAKSKSDRKLKSPRSDI